MQKCSEITNYIKGENMIIKGIEEGQDIYPVKYYGVVGDNGCGVFRI